MGCWKPRWHFHLNYAHHLNFLVATPLVLTRLYTHTNIHTHIDAKKKSQRILQISPRSSSRTSCPTTHSFLTFCQRTSHSYGNGNFCLRFLRHCLQCRFGFGSPDSDWDSGASRLIKTEIHNGPQSATSV